MGIGFLFEFSKHSMHEVGIRSIIHRDFESVNSFCNLSCRTLCPTKSPTFSKMCAGNILSIRFVIFAVIFCSISPTLCAPPNASDKLGEYLHIVADASSLSIF